MPEALTPFCDECGRGVERGRRLCDRCSDESRHRSTDDLCVTDHAQQRYQQRTNSAIPDVRLERVWELAAPIGAPHVDGTVRLYPPEDILLVAHTGAVRTVLHVGDEKLNDDHLKVCGNCESRWDPVAHDACNWCRAVRNEESTADVTKPTEARTHSTI